MTPFAVQDVQEPQEMKRMIPSSQLSAALVSDTTPWLYAALSQLRDLEHNGENVPGVGDFRLSEETANHVRLLLSFVDLRQELPAPILSPISGGAVAIQWTLGNKELAFSLYPGRRVSYIQLEHDEVIQNDPVPLQKKEVLKPLRWLLELP